MRWFRKPKCRISNNNTCTKNAHAYESVISQNPKLVSDDYTIYMHC